MTSTTKQTTLDNLGGGQFIRVALITTGIAAIAVIALTVALMSGAAGPARDDISQQAGYPDFGLRQAPAVQAPAVESYPDFGQRHRPAGTER